MYKVRGTRSIVPKSPSRRVVEAIKSPIECHGNLFFLNVRVTRLSSESVKRATKKRKKYLRSVVLLGEVSSQPREETKDWEPICALSAETRTQNVCIGCDIVCSICRERLISLPIIWCSGGV